MRTSRDKRLRRNSQQRINQSGDAIKHGRPAQAKHRTKKLRYTK